MDDVSNPPPPKTLADELAEITPGGSRLYDVGRAPTIRSTLTRMKKTRQSEFITRAEGDTLRVWRLA